MVFQISKNQVACSIAIFVICRVGDANSKPVKEGDLAAALCDNLTHGFVGLFTWAAVILSKSSLTGYTAYLEIILCALISSLIDLDHFAAAKSVHLKDATNLTNRPLLHCTSGMIFVTSIVIALACWLQINWLYKIGWITVAAILSHHIRDSTRRGFWLWPFGSTRPIPYAVYLAAEVLLPHVIAIIMSTKPLMGNRNYVHSYTTVV